jgi:hypothetical protein
MNYIRCAKRRLIEEDWKKNPDLKHTGVIIFIPVHHSHEARSAGIFYAVLFHRNFLLCVD